MRSQPILASRLQLQLCSRAPQSLLGLGAGWGGRQHELEVQRGPRWNGQRKLGEGLPGAPGRGKKGREDPKLSRHLQARGKPGEVLWREATILSLGLGLQESRGDLNMALLEVGIHTRGQNLRGPFLVWDRAWEITILAFSACCSRPP